MAQVLSRVKNSFVLDIGPIDTDLLNAQKQALVEMIWNDMDNILWGLVYMLDDICDAIEDEG
jgi:hypothetical protein